LAAIKRPPLDVADCGTFSHRRTRFRLTAVLLTDETEAFEAASHGRRNGSSAARAWGLLKEAAERVFVSA